MIQISHDNGVPLKILLQISRVLRASLHLATLGLYSISTFGSLISNDERPLPVWFQLSLLKSTSKDKIALFESFGLDGFLSLVKGSVMILGRFDDSLVSLFFELV